MASSEAVVLADGVSFKVAKGSSVPVLKLSECVTVAASLISSFSDVLGGSGGEAKAEDGAGENLAGGE